MILWSNTSWPSPDLKIFNLSVVFCNHATSKGSIERGVSSKEDDCSDTWSTANFSKLELWLTIVKLWSSCEELAFAVNSPYHSLICRLEFSQFPENPSQRPTDLKLEMFTLFNGLWQHDAVKEQEFQCMTQSKFEEYRTCYVESLYMSTELPFCGVVSSQKFPWEKDLEIVRCKSEIPQLCPGYGSWRGVFYVPERLPICLVPLFILREICNFLEVSLREWRWNC